MQVIRIGNKMYVRNDPTDIFCDHETGERLSYDEMAQAAFEGRIEKVSFRPVIRCSENKELILYRNAEKVWIYEDGGMATMQCLRDALNNIVDGAYELGVDFI